MNKLEKRMVEILSSLREGYGATAVKCSLEAEGIRLDELLRTKEIVLRSGVGLTVKIGGCEALTDLRLSKMYGVNSVMAPMLESRFALEKFLDMAHSEFTPDELEEIKLIINIETVDGYEKFDRILEAADLNRLHGIVLGRTDLCNALKLKDTNAPEVLVLAKDLFSKAKKHGLSCVVGGGITGKSVPFLKELDGGIDGYETRKVVFGDYPKAQMNMEEGIRLALTFEYYWYEWKQLYYGALYQEDAAKHKSIASMLNL
jgi:hypothetical protein